MRYIFFFLLLFFPTTVMAQDRLSEVEDQAITICKYVQKHRRSFYISEVSECDRFIDSVHQRRVKEWFTDLQKQLKDLDPEESKHIQEIIDKFK